VSAAGLAREGRVVAALGRRALSVQFRRAQLLMPTFVLPLMLLAVIASGTSAAQGLDAFPEVSSYLGFVAPGTIIQGTLLAGLTAGIAVAADIEGGFFDRLLAAPVNRASSSSGASRARSASPRSRSHSSWPWRRSSARATPAESAAWRPPWCSVR